ncbi:hypothetical protein FEM33_01095 [Dyadobacter flavalbus]|uniref:Uncharacterized protein n=1 Tax=Dyadobacter flavalbus TaxID=2579942 RepID=A0A5M8QZ81_9BACT|nr:hypothetical protein [Dyadobacter flavalbus]KAA6441615.1 hypothetical protein FEM33_01095 [Dyadobacter flavalbus]
MDTKRFTGKEGELVSAEAALRLTSLYQARQNKILERGDKYVKAEFFGIHTFNELISMHGDKCAGFRIYYGIREEEEDASENKRLIGREIMKKPTSRLILVPVDEDGNDLTASAQLGGLKDMPAMKEVMLGGPLCPSQC